MEEKKLPPTPSFNPEDSIEELSSEEFEETILEVEEERANNILDELNESFSRKEETSPAKTEKASETSDNLESSQKIEAQTEAISQPPLPLPENSENSDLPSETSQSDNTEKTKESLKKKTEEKKKKPEQSGPSKENGFKKFLNNINVWRALSLILAFIAIFALIQYSSLSSFSSSQADEIHSLKMERSDLEMERDDLKKSNQDLSDEIEELNKANKDLEDELNEFETRVDELLERIKRNFDQGNWQAVIDGYNALHEDFPNASQDKEAKKLADQAQENLNEEKAAAEQRQKEQQEAQEKARQEQQKNQNQNANQSQTSQNSQTNQSNQNNSNSSSQNLQSYNTGITFAQLSTAPANYAGQKVQFSGRVLSINYESSKTSLRLAINGDADMVVLGEYTPNLSNVEIDDNNWITIYGTSKGENTYTSDSNGMVLTPIIEVQHITKS